MARLQLTKLTLRYEPAENPSRSLGVKCAVPASWLAKPTPCEKLIKFFCKTYLARRNEALDANALELLRAPRATDPVDRAAPIRDLLAGPDAPETLYLGTPAPPDPCAAVDARSAALLEQFQNGALDRQSFMDEMNAVQAEKQRILAALPDDECSGDDDASDAGDDAAREGPALPGGGDDFDFGGGDDFGLGY